MNIHQKKLRREAIIARELEINADLAASKRRYFTEGVDRPMAERATLEDELAQLAVEKNVLTKALNDHKTAMKAYRNTLQHAVLIKLLADRGLGELVIEADHAAQELATSAEAVV